MSFEGSSFRDAPGYISPHLLEPPIPAPDQGRNLDGGMLIRGRAPTPATELIATSDKTSQRINRQQVIQQANREALIGGDLVDLTEEHLDIPPVDYHFTAGKTKTFRRTYTMEEDASSLLSHVPRASTKDEMVRLDIMAEVNPSMIGMNFTPRTSPDLSEYIEPMLCDLESNKAPEVILTSIAREKHSHSSLQVPNVPATVHDQIENHYQSIGDSTIMANNILQEATSQQQKRPSGSDQRFTSLGKRPHEDPILDGVEQVKQNVTVFRDAGISASTYKKPRLGSHVLQERSHPLQMINKVISRQKAQLTPSHNQGLKPTPKIAEAINKDNTLKSIDTRTNSVRTITTSMNTPNTQATAQETLIKAPNGNSSRDSRVSKLLGSHNRVKRQPQVQRKSERLIARKSSTRPQLPSQVEDQLHAQLQQQLHGAATPATSTPIKNVRARGNGSTSRKRNRDISDSYPHHKPSETGVTSSRSKRIKTREAETVTIAPRRSERIGKRKTI